MSSPSTGPDAMARAADAEANPTDPCIHCGFCLPSCASYRVLGTEMDSPRGRIHMLKAIDRGELQLDATVAKHFDSCLGCFACVIACPSGVRYDQLIDAARPLLNAPELRSPGPAHFPASAVPAAALPRRLRALLAPLRLYAGTPLQALARRSGLTRLFGPQLAAMERLLPPLQPGLPGLGPALVPARGRRRHRVGLVLGCVQRLFDPAVNAAADRAARRQRHRGGDPPRPGLLRRRDPPPGGTGADPGAGRGPDGSFEAVIGRGPAGGPRTPRCPAGGGLGLRPHPQEVRRDPGGGPRWAARGSAFATQVADIQEFLAAVGLSEEFPAALRPLLHDDGTPASADRPLELVYHDACHQLHGQGLQAQPRRLLGRIPHVRIREATEAGVCCGSAGIYNLVQPEEAAELGRIKAADLSGTGADLAVSANIGCTLQIRQAMADTPGPWRWSIRWNCSIAATPGRPAASIQRQACRRVPASPRLPGKVSTGRGVPPVLASTTDSPGSNWPCSSTISRSSPSASRVMGGDAPLADQIAQEGARAAPRRPITPARTSPRARRSAGCGRGPPRGW